MAPIDKALERCGRVFALAASLIVISTVPAAAVDEPVVILSHHNLAPQRIEVHVGERIRWRSAGGERLRLVLDAHPNAHEVIVRDGEISAVFVEPGEHWYTGSVVKDGERRFRGVVVVREREGPVGLPPVCGPGSSRVICVEP